MAITLYVEGLGTIFAEYDGYKSTELINKAIDDEWILYDDELEDWFITAGAWEEGVRNVITMDMDDDGKPYSTLIADQPEPSYEEEDNE